MTKAPERFLKKLKEVDLSKHICRNMTKEELDIKNRITNLIESNKFNVFISTLYTGIKRLETGYSLEFLHYLEDILHKCF